MHEPPAQARQHAPGVPGKGPDVIVGDIHDAQSYGSENDASAFAIGTTSCNEGSAPLDWVRNTSQHPVIAQNLYRINDGRIEQIALSWLKHGFFALNEDLCATCQAPANHDGTKLWVNCSDPYDAGLNGAQANLGPRSQVNPSTGVFPFPPRHLPGLPNPGLLAGRLQVANADLDPALNAGAVYVAEAQYVHPQDAQAGNGNNNASHRIVTFPIVRGQFNLTLDPNKPTVRTLPAIHAWKAQYPNVRLFNVDVPMDGRFILGIRSTKAGAGFHHEVAIYNLNSDRAARALTVTTPAGAVKNPGFHGVKYHAEDYADNDWVAGPNGPAMGWSTDKFTVNANANALRWGTLYSFWFDSDQPVTQAVIELFKPGGAMGAPTQMTVDLTGMPPPPLRLMAVAPRHWAADGAKADRDLGPSRTFRLEARPKVDREIEPIESNLPGLKATAKKRKDETKGVVFWEVTVEPPATLKGRYFEALLRFKTTTKDDPPLTLRVHGDLPGK